MWLDLFAPLSETLSHIVAFSLAMHNSGAQESLHAFQNGWPQPEKRSLSDLFKRGE